MTDSTVKNASMIAEDTLIKMKHTACGHIANVPNWIIGELAEEDRISSKHGEVEIECPCNGPREESNNHCMIAGQKNLYQITQICHGILV